MNDLYLSHLRQTGRRFAATILPGPRRATRHIAVSGLPRSGTSWLGKALSLAPQVAYFFEPDETLEARYRYRYLSAADREDHLEAHIRDAFSGRVRADYVLAEQGLRELVSNWRARTVLCKWVKFVICLDWVAQNFPDIQVVQTVRHPVALILSWRELGWEPANALRILLAQSALLEGPLHAIAPVLRDAESPWEKRAAFWAAIAYMQLQQHRPGWLLVEHEWLCLDPVPHVRRIVEGMGLEWTERIGQFASGERRAASGAGYGRNRDPRAEIRKWEGKVDEAALREVRSVLERVKLPFYPNLDPEACWAGERLARSSAPGAGA